MSASLNRLVFTVAPCEGGWSVAQDGERTWRGASKDEALAQAAKQMRVQHDRGQPCQIRVTGDPGYFTA